MKRLLSLALLLALLLCGCSDTAQYAQVAATTLPVYEMTSRLCEGTSITVTRLITEEVSCLHDYSLNVRQVKAAEAAELVVISGAGLEAFLDDMLLTASLVDASDGIRLLCPEDAEGSEHDHQEYHGHEAHSHEGHTHDRDPHIWLDPGNAIIMSENICRGLSARYPEHSSRFEQNLETLTAELEALLVYGRQQLSQLSCRELITFHDGFAYLADCFGLTVLEAVEEESGSEASARELISLIRQVRHHSLPAIFVERSGSDSAASIIARETGAKVYMLDMAMASDSYFDAMYHNIDTLKEALG